MNTGHLKYERDQIAAFRKVHAAMCKHAADNGCDDPVELANEIGPDAFDRMVTEECEAQGVNAEAFEAWAAQPDNNTEILESMGYFGE